MFIATVIVVILLAVALTAAAAGKLTKKPALVEQMGTLGITTQQLPILGSLELVGAIGLVVGLFWWPIGVAVAVGVIGFFIGAVVVHLRANDTKGTAPAAMLALLAIAALVLRLLSM